MSDLFKLDLFDVKLGMNVSVEPDIWEKTI